MEGADRLFDMLNNAADGVFVIDEDQRIIFWNPAAQEILGYTVEDVMGRPCYEVLGGCDDRGRVVCCPECYVASVAHSGQAVNSYDVAVRTKAGKQCWLNVSILVSSANSKIPTPLVVHLFRDATRHKNREKFILQWLQEAERLQAATLPPLPPPPPSPRADDLTDREREVLALLAHGISTAKIARTLSISPATARNHIQNILNKLHVHSRLEAVAYAFEHGLVSRE